MGKIVTPRSTMIEKVAAELACVWYEIGRGQGLTSKWPNARKYAAANLEKFIPKATDILLDMLKPTSNCSHEMREEIYSALMERHNDPELNAVLPNIDVKKLLAIIDETERKKVVEINDTIKWCETHNREANRCLSQGGKEGGILLPCVIINKIKPKETGTVLDNKTLPKDNPFKAMRH